MTVYAHYYVDRFMSSCLYIYMTYHITTQQSLVVEHVEAPSTTSEQAERLLSII